MKGILAIGDCNTRGLDQYRGKSYPERVAEQFGCTVKNSGFTMSTTREGIHLIRDNLTLEYDVVCIQFGLVDSYMTFRHAPYILYYPDNFLRKTFRNILKKYKKTCRQIGLNRRLGEINVVPEEEFERNIREMIASCGDSIVILPETIPHHDSRRNPWIQRYNAILHKVAHDYQSCHVVKAYDEFAMNLNNYYADTTHMNSAGYAVMTDRITRKLFEIL